MTILLDNLIPAGMFVGTSLIIRQGEHFLYGIRPLKHDADRPALEITGIGGGVEADDESYSAGVRREAMEEIRCPISLLASDRTLIVRDGETIEEAVLVGEERPAAVVFRYYRTPAHRPWHPTNQGAACLLVYRAGLEGRPQVTAELPSLIWLRPEQIVETARRDVLLADLLAGGARLVQGHSKTPLDAWGRLTDSQEALALALGDRAQAFFTNVVGG